MYTTADVKVVISFVKCNKVLRIKVQHCTKTCFKIMLKLKKEETINENYHQNVDMKK